MSTVASIMTSDVITIRSSARVSEAIALMQQRSIQALIVDKANDSDAYGIVTAGDIVAKVVAFGKDPQRIRVFEIMTKPCIVLNPNLGIEHAAALLSQAHLHSAPVIQTKLLGLLSITDILQSSYIVQKPQVLELAGKIQQASATARQICEEAGPGSPNCAEAWSVVDALQAEIARYTEKPLEKTASEAFWSDYSNVLQDREYDEWCSG